MKLADYQKMWSKDCRIDQSNLGSESSKVPYLHGKWLNHYTDEKLLLCRLNADYKRLYKTKWQYYTGKLSEEELEEHGWEPIDHRILKTDLHIFLEADDGLTAKADKLAFQKAKVEFLEKVLNQIGQRQWNIKGAIDWRKFENGE